MLNVDVVSNTSFIVPDDDNDVNFVDAESPVTPKIFHRNRFTFYSKLVHRTIEKLTVA